MKKRLISLVLVLVLALSLLPVAALAADYDDFSDLKDNVWYTPYIDFVLEKGYFVGMSDTEFAPGGTMTRAMFVTVIARMQGAEVDDSVEPSFPDVKANAWYTGSVEWAAANGIVEGYEDGSFRPGNYVTRYEMVAIMDRYINWRMETTGDKVVLGDKEVSFADQADIDGVAWAKACVDNCVSYGLLEGYPDGTFGGKRNSTRAEVAAIIERLDWIIHGGDHIYKAVLNITNEIKDVVNTAFVKAEDLSEEYKDDIYAIAEEAGYTGDLTVDESFDASLTVGENINGTRTVSLTAYGTLSEKTAYNLVKAAAGCAVLLFAEAREMGYAEIKEVVRTIKDELLDKYDLLTEEEIAEISELVYNKVRAKVSDLWTENFKGPKGYYTGDITIKVGDYTGVILVNEETGATLPNWTAEAAAFGVALAQEVGYSMIAQAQEYTNSIDDVGAIIDITFSAGAYKDDTDRYAYNYPIDISFTFENEVDTFQYKLKDGVYLKAFISKEIQERYRAAVNTIIDKVMESEEFMAKFNPAMEDVKADKFAPVIDILAQSNAANKDLKTEKSADTFAALPETIADDGKADDNKADDSSVSAEDLAFANELIDKYLNEWAKTNATSKVTGDGEWNNEALYEMVDSIGVEIADYIEKELDENALELTKDITPEQLKQNMVDAGIEIDVDPALENYVLAVVCDQVVLKAEPDTDPSKLQANKYYEDMTKYIDAEVPGALESNDNFNQAFEMLEKVRGVLTSTDQLSAVKFSNISAVLRNETVQSYLAYEKVDNYVARFAGYIQKVPAGADLVIAGCTLNEAAIIELKDAKTVVEVCDILADIIDETGLGKLSLADFAPEGGQNITVRYDGSSATANLVIEFEK